MPRINLCFSGLVTGAYIENCYDPKTGKNVQVSNMTAGELCEKLYNNELFIDFEDCVKYNQYIRIECFDYVPYRSLP